jgi:hypothetical protein
MSSHSRSQINAQTFPFLNFIISPFTSQIMKAFYTLTLLCVAACCATTQQAAAQGIPNYGSNPLQGNQPSSVFYIQAANSSSTGSYIEMWGNNSGAHGNIGYVAGLNPNNNNNESHLFWVPSTSGGYSKALTILQSGQVSIGTTKPTAQPDYKLSVSGKLVAQSMYVTNPSNWADFVFEPNHKFMTLPALETYLQQNKHLPAIPSANEIIANGYNVTEMNAKLLQSLEELTLQVIQLNKEVEKLKAQADY